MTKLTAGERIKDIMIERKGGVVKDAEEIGISPSTLSEFLNGKRDINSDTLSKICKYYNVSADYVLGLSEISIPDIEMQSVSKITGLSENAIEFFIQNKRADKELRQDYCKTINAILENLSFQESLDWIYRAIDTKEARGIKIAKKIKECSEKGISAEDITENIDYNKKLAEKIVMSSKFMNVENLDYGRIQNDIIFLSEFAPDLTVLNRKETAELYLQKAEKLFRETIEKIYKEG